MRQSTASGGRKGISQKVQEHLGSPLVPARAMPLPSCSSVPTRMSQDDETAPTVLPDPPTTNDAQKQSARAQPPPIPPSLLSPSLSNGISSYSDLREE
eukprot:9159923-Ditylum_brightwellii.AAC.1